MHSDNAAMAVARFFAETLETGIVRLDPAEARHAAKVRRLSVGEPVVLFDGNGREGTGAIAAVGRGGLEVEVAKVLLQPRPTPGLTLAVALPKGPRQEVLVEKCTELGVHAIQPLITERSVAGASEHRLGKWRRTAIEAAKQSGQCWVPELRAPKSLAAVAAEIGHYDLAVVAAFGGGRLAVPKTVRRILAFVGPEGGWTPEEETLLTTSGALAVSLGPNVLRIETAAVAVAAMVHGIQMTERVGERESGRAGEKS